VPASQPITGWLGVASGGATTSCGDAWLAAMRDVSKKARREARVGFVA